MHRHIRSDVNTTRAPGHPVSRETHSQECPEWGQAGLGAVPCSEMRQGNPQLLEPRGGAAPGTRTPAPLCLCSPPQAAELLGLASPDKKAVGWEAGKEKEAEGQEGVGGHILGRVGFWQGKSWGSLEPQEMPRNPSWPGLSS